MALRALGERWRSIQSSLGADPPRRLDALLIGPVAASLSTRTERAVIEFVHNLQACCPELHSEQALRHRYHNGCMVSLASIVLGVTFAQVHSSNLPIIGDPAFVLFVIACWSLVTTIQLKRAHRLVQGIWRSPGLHERATQAPLRKRADKALPDR